MIKNLNDKSVMADNKSIIILYILISTAISSLFILGVNTNSANAVENTNNSNQLMSESLSKNSPTTEIYKPENKLYGLSYEDHAKNFWKWFVSIPNSTNPEHDLTGARCSIGQEKSNSLVFYLSPGKNNTVIEKECTVTNGKGLLIPIIVVEYSDEEEFIDENIDKTSNLTLDDMSEIITNLTRKAKNDQDGVQNMYLKLDEKEYQMEDLSKYRINTGAFVLNFPQDPVWGVKEGPAMAVADGHYIISEPLTKGNHTVHWKSDLTCPINDKDCVDFRYSQDVKYNIIVK
jgi:hypothetical protein